MHRNGTQVQIEKNKGRYGIEYSLASASDTPCPRVCGAHAKSGVPSPQIFHFNHCLWDEELNRNDNTARLNCHGRIHVIRNRSPPQVPFTSVSLTVSPSYTPFQTKSTIFAEKECIWACGASAFSGRMLVMYNSGS